jgi:hypothetical protein
MLWLKAYGLRYLLGFGVEFHGVPWYAECCMCADLGSLLLVARPCRSCVKKKAPRKAGAACAGAAGARVLGLGERGASCRGGACLDRPWESDAPSLALAPPGGWPHPPSLLERPRLPPAVTSVSAPNTRPLIYDHRGGGGAAGALGQYQTCPAAVRWCVSKNTNSLDVAGCSCPTRARG